MVIAMVSTGARSANGMEGFPAQEASPPADRASPHPLPRLETVLSPVPGLLTSASLRTAQDTQPPETRHLSPEGSRSPGNPEAVTRQLPPLDNGRKQGTGKCPVNRKPGAGARPPRMRASARKKAGRSRRTMAELGEADEAELQRLVAAEQQKAQFTAQVRGRGPGWRERRLRCRLSF